jgi:hypothetical protein
LNQHALPARGVGGQYCSRSKRIRKQTSASYAADCDVIACYGGAKPTDKHLASKIHCVDDQIYRLAEAP